jgi:cytochrome c oxidase subunit 2
MLQRLRSAPRVLALAFALALIAATSESPIAIVASNWKFTPSTITLRAGEPRTLHFTSSEGVHGVQSDALGIPLTTIAPGKGVDVTVTPKTTGTFVLPCAIMCGAGHEAMKLTVKVVQ